MLGDILKSLRESHGYQSRFVAEKLNVAKSTYSGYENNKSTPDYNTLKEISLFYNVSIDYLLENNTDTISTDKDIIKKKLNKILEKYGIVKPGEDLTDDQVEWLMKLVDKAIEMTKLD